MQPPLTSAERDRLAEASDLMLDCFTTDVVALAAGEPFDRTLMRTHLPEAFKERYDLSFAIRFLAAAARAQARLAAGVVYPASCVAEELALRALRRTALAIAEDAGDAQLADRVDGIFDGLVLDTDIDLLFDGRMVLSREQARLLGATHLWFDEWFRPFDMPSVDERSALN